MKALDMIIDTGGGIGGFLDPGPGVKGRFGVCLMNPPYGNLGYRFLEKVLGISDKVVSVQPMGYVTSKKQMAGITKYIDEYGAEITSENGMSAFEGVKLMQNLGIFHLDKTKKSDIVFDGKKYEKSSDITLYSNDEYLVRFNDIIDTLLSDNLDNHLKATPESIKYKSKIERNPDPEWWCVRIPAIRGHVSPDSGMIKDDYYTIISNSDKELYKILGQYKDLSAIKDRKSSINPNPDKKSLEYYFPFDTETEMRNFYNYLRTDFCRACYRLVKNASNVFSGGELKRIPWFDFSDGRFSKPPKEIDDWLFGKFNIGSDIREHIEEILPDYYNIR